MLKSVCVCACVFRCVSRQVKEKNVRLITCCGFNFPDISCTRSASFTVVVTSPLATRRNTSVFSLLIYLRLYNPFFVSVKPTDEMVHKVGQNWVLPTHVPGPLFRRYFPATIKLSLPHSGISISVYYKSFTIIGCKGVGFPFKNYP